MFISRLIHKRKNRRRKNSWSEAFDVDFEDDGKPYVGGFSSFIPMEEEHVDDNYSLKTFIDSETTETTAGMASSGTGTIISDQTTPNFSTGVRGYEPFPGPAASSEDVKVPASSAMDFAGRDMAASTPPPPSSSSSSVLSGDSFSRKLNDQKAPPPRSMTSPSSGSVGKAEEKSSSSSRPLPKDFEPNDYSVIVGRGKKVRQSAGNLHLRTLCSTYLSQYSNAMNNKPVKTEIVNSIIAIIRAVCPNGGSGAFIRMEDGVWCEVSDRVAREKVGYVFRDLLHDKYESSAQSKAAKKNRRLSATSSVHSASSSTSSLVQHERPDKTSSSSTTTTTAMLPPKQDHAYTLPLSEPTTLPPSQTFSGSVSRSGYVPSFSPMSPVPLSTIQQQQQQQHQHQHQLPFDQMMMMPPIPMAFQMMPHLPQQQQQQQQQSQYAGSNMMGAFPQQMQQQIFSFHQNQTASGQNLNPQLSDGDNGRGGVHQDQWQQQHQQRRQHLENLHSSPPYDNQQYHPRPDAHLAAGTASDASAASAEMMMMMMSGTMMEPSPIGSSAGHMDHSHNTTATSTPSSTMQQQHGWTVDHAMRGTIHSFSADEMTQLVQNSELGRGLEDGSSSFIVGGGGGDEGSANDQDDSANNN